MMVSLFSVFDPVGMFSLPINWLSMIMVVFFIPVGYYMMSSMGCSVFGMIVSKVGGMFKEISYPQYYGIVTISLLLFFYISVNNFMGLFPYIFTSTSHIIVTMSMGVVFWLSFFVMGWLSNFVYSLAHLVPEGGPLLLSPFMVVIESVSHLIRPITLSVRLAANMMAGHLIIGLIAEVSEVSFLGGVISVFMQSVMMVLELAVSFIQAFVFSVLVLLYALEYY